MLELAIDHPEMQGGLHSGSVRARNPRSPSPPPAPDLSRGGDGGPAPVPAPDLPEDGTRLRGFRRSRPKTGRT